MKARLMWKTKKPLLGFVPILRKRIALKSLNIARQVWIAAVNRTPADSGELRASWNLSMDRPDYSTVGRADSSPNNRPSPLPAPMPPKLEPVPNANYFVSNGKDYAGFVEYGTETIEPKLMLTRALQSIGGA